MNERIKLLAEQAKDWAYSDHDGYTAQMLFEQKFAELIVAHATECVRDVFHYEKSDLSYAAVLQVQDRIKQHFGVEE